MAAVYPLPRKLLASLLAACLVSAPALGQTARSPRPTLHDGAAPLPVPPVSELGIPVQPIESSTPAGLAGAADLPSLKPETRSPAAAVRIEPAETVQDGAQTPAVGSPEFQNQLEAFQERALQAETQPAGGGAHAWTSLRQAYDGGSRGLGLAVVALPAAAAIAASPWFYQHASLAAMIGSGALTVVGMPQIVKNFRCGREATKDVSLSWPLIWFAVGVLLSAVSLANGSNFWWTASNLAAVGQSVLMTAQINAYNRDRAGWKKSLWTAALVLAPLILGGMLLPTPVWTQLAFAAAVTLLLVIGWPQIRMNHLLYESERRGPDGIALLKPLLLLLGGIFNLIAAAAAKDLFWALNNAVSLAATLTLAAQMFFPKAANALLGPLLRRVIRIEDKILAAWKGR